MAAAMKPSRATMNAASMHAAAAKATSTATEAAASATARIRIIRDQTYGEQNDCCKNSENVFEHRAPPDLGVR